MLGSSRLSRGGRARGPGQPLLLALGLAAIAALTATLYLGFTAARKLPLQSYYFVNAQFDNADNLNRQAQVRVAGRRVGQVDSTRVEDGKAIVRLRLDTAIKPLRSDTRLQVRPLSAVGTRFIEMVPGQRGRPLPDGATIPARQTSATVALDEVLSTLDARRRTHARALLKTLGVGFAGRGADASDAMRDFPPALRSASNVARAIEGQGGLAPFVRAGQGSANAADPVRGDIAQGFTTGQRTLGVFASHTPAFEQTLDDAPPLMRIISSELPQASRLFGAVRRFSRAAVPALSAGRGALRETSALLRAGRPGLRAAPAVLRLLKPATPAVLNLTKTIDPVLPPLHKALSSSLPPAHQLAPRECDLKRFVSNWASILSWGNDFSNYLRYNVVSPDAASAGGGPGPRPAIYSSPYPQPCEYDSQQVPRP